MKSVFTALCLLALAVFGTGHAAADVSCDAPQPVCNSAAAVYMIKAFDPFASAVRISENLLVTSRHAVADNTDVEVIRKDGSTVRGEVRPTSYDGDLVLIEVAGLADGPVLERLHELSTGLVLYTVGGDDSQRAIRVYAPGRVLLLPDTVTGHGRLHHTAYSQFGNSGGALVDGKGRLVGIISSGGEGRFEAIPAGEIDELVEQSGPEHATRNAEIGTAVRQCIEFLDRPGPRTLPDARAQAIHNACAQSANRQLYDLAAQVLGIRRHFDLALDLSNRSVTRDPHALNARLTLLTILQLSARFDEAVPHVRFLLQHLPEEPSVHRFAVQVGKWTGNLDMANEGLALIKKHNPAQAEAAERFIKADIPRPQPRP